MSTPVDKLLALRPGLAFYFGCIAISLVIYPCSAFYASVSVSVSFVTN